MIINNENILNINFNNQNVDILKFNGEIVWQKKVSSYYYYQVSKEYQGLTTDDNINYAYVYDDSKWYALNTDKQYEQWGVYEDTDNINSITKYEGKLATVSSTSEYEYSNGSWKYLGEVSGGFSLIGQIDRDNPPSTFPTDFYLKKDDLDEFFDLRITSPNRSQEIEISFNPWENRYTVRDEGMRYEGTVEEETINGVVYVHFSCPSYPNDSIDVESVEWWNDPIDYYGNSTVIPKKYDKSIFDECPLYQGYYYGTEDEIKIGKNIIYNIGGILKEYDGKAFVTSEKTYEDIYMIFDVNGGSDTNPNEWGVEVIYDENFNVTANEDLQNGITYYGVMNKDVIGVQNSSCPINFINCAIPNSVTSIGDWAFSNCKSLTSIDLPSCTSVGGSAFNGCSSLTSVSLPNCTSVGERAFFICTSLTSIDLPNCTSVGDMAFNDCSKLTSVTIGDSVETIGNYTFSGCTSLTSITIPDSVTSIGQSAFQNCKSLTSVNIGDSVTTINTFTFVGCSSLTSVTIPNSVTSLGTRAFGAVPTSGTLYCYKDWYDNLTSTQIASLDNVYNWNKVWLDPPIGYGQVKLIIDDGREIIDTFEDGGIPVSKYGSVGYHTSGMDNVIEIVIGDGITIIGQGAFTGCTNATALTIGNDVQTINGFAFQSLGYITTVTLPSSVTEIKGRCFSECRSLADFNFKGTISQWNSMTKGFLWNLDCPFTVVHCSDGDVAV